MLSDYRVRYFQLTVTYLCFVGVDLLPLLEEGITPLFAAPVPRYPRDFDRLLLH